MDTNVKIQICGFTVDVGFAGLRVNTVCMLMSECLSVCVQKCFNASSELMLFTECNHFCHSRLEAKQSDTNVVVYMQ